MNAKKIMGAVLVALLAAALFVGAGAAVEETNLGTVYLYQNAGLPDLDGTYYCGDAAISNVSGTVVPNDLSKFVNGGKYSNGSAFVIVKLPNVEFTAVGNANADPTYDAMANGLIAGQNVTFTPLAGGSGVANIILYKPDGTPISLGTTGATTLTNVTAKGEWQIQGVLDGTSLDTGIMPSSLLYGQKYSFNVYSAEPGLTLASDTVIVENFIVATITGVPGHVIDISAPGFDIPADNQVVKVGAIASGDVLEIITTYVDSGVDKAVEAKVKMPNTGSVIVYLKAMDDGKKTITVEDGDKDVEADVKIVKGAITAQADADSFFIGNPITLSGTSTAGNDLFFYIEGTNFPFVQLGADDFKKDAVVENGEWTVELYSENINSGSKKLVAGTYTIVVSTNNTSAGLAPNKSLKETAMGATYATAAVTLTQPFLTGIEAAEVAIQDTDYFITGTAYSADYVYLYVFGTNFFYNKSVETDDESFEFEIDQDVTVDMAPGTYFYLIQHPMNDGKFNVWESTASNTVLNSPVGAVAGDFYYAATGAKNVTFAFNVWERGTNYAAQALLETIAGQDIDDIFVQGTFKVEAQKLTINPIPAEVAQGEKLAVSGTTNSGEGVEVIVNVLAGTFDATIKGDENSATFLTQKAVTNEDGTFEAAIDTSKLEVGNYIVTVELNGQMYDSAAVEIVAAADKPVDPEQPEQPENPEQPEQPTEPTTPGFGALAALAGLGAVAVLLLRRE